VFSLDSVITAVGLVDHVSIMVIAIVLAVGVMLFAAKPIGQFVDNNPTIKMLALAFLLLIGFTLMAEGFDVHVPKGYIYFAMAFSIGVELLNMRVRKKKETEVILLSKNVPMNDIA
jgi:predicted tellurium resistance membrane protein TerC